MNNDRSLEISSFEEFARKYRLSYKRLEAFGLDTLLPQNGGLTRTTEADFSSVEPTKRPSDEKRDHSKSSKPVSQGLLSEIDSNTLVELFSLDPDHKQPSIPHETQILISQDGNMPIWSDSTYPQHNQSSNNAYSYQLTLLSDPESSAENYTVAPLSTIKHEQAHIPVVLDSEGPSARSSSPPIILPLRYLGPND